MCIRDRTTTTTHSRADDLHPHQPIQPRLLQPSREHAPGPTQQRHRRTARGSLTAGAPHFSAPSATRQGRRLDATPARHQSPATPPAGSVRSRRTTTAGTTDDHHRRSQSPLWQRHSGMGRMRTFTELDDASRQARARLHHATERRAGGAGLSPSPKKLKM